MTSKNSLMLGMLTGITLVIQAWSQEIPQINSAGLLFTTIDPWAPGLPQNVSTLKGEKLHPPLKTYLDYEFHGNVLNNPKERKSPQAFNLEYYEIPAKVMTHTFFNEGEDITPFKEFISFKKNGEDYVKWFINPEDTFHYKNLEAFLHHEGIPVVKKTSAFELKSYLTASRSIILNDPVTGKTISMKVSTNHCGGVWKDKGVTMKQAQKAVASTDLALQGKKIYDTKYDSNLIYQEENIGLAIMKSGVPMGEGPDQCFDQAMIIRNVPSLDKSQNDYFLIPGFSLMHSIVGKSLAAQGGRGKDAGQYWVDHLSIPLGKAMADFTIHSALSMTSAHSQQWYLEVDKFFRPTGNIHLKDYMDSDVVLPLVKPSDFSPSQSPDKEQAEFLENVWKGKHDYAFPKLKVLFGPHLRMGWPKWVDGKTKTQLEDAFYDSFEKRFSELSGIPLEKLVGLKDKTLRSTKANSYTGAFYDLKKGADLYPEVKKFVDFRPCLQGKPFDRKGVPCDVAFQELGTQTCEGKESFSPSSFNATVVKTAEDLLETLDHE